jgi:hypothetical protein
MWFMNKIANPFVRLILRSPLHGMMSTALLLLTYRGRKSGREYSLPVQYAQDGKRIYIVPGAPKQKTWWCNLSGGLPVHVTLRGKTLSGNGRILDPVPDGGEIVKGFGLYLGRFPVMAKAYQVGVEGDRGFNEKDLRKAAGTVQMVMVELDSNQS